MKISVDDVQRLLDASDDEVVLVVMDRRTEVVPAAELRSAEYRGARRVASRQEVVERAGGTKLSERQLAAEAQKLDAAVRNLGG